MTKHIKKLHTQGSQYNGTLDYVSPWKHVNTERQIQHMFLRTRLLLEVSSPERNAFHCAVPFTRNHPKTQIAKNKDNMNHTKTLFNQLNHQVGPSTINYARVTKANPFQYNPEKQIQDPIFAKKRRNHRNPRQLRMVSLGSEMLTNHNETKVSKKSIVCNKLEIEHDMKAQAQPQQFWVKQKESKMKITKRACSSLVKTIGVRCMKERLKQMNKTFVFQQKSINL